MTDPELIQLVQEKTPDELSPAEVDALRSRLAESDELRQTLFGQVKMEEYLARALGTVEVRVGEILSRADQQSGGSRWLPMVAILACFGLLVLVAAVFVNMVSNNDARDEEAVADRPDEKAAEQPADKATSEQTDAAVDDATEPSVAAAPDDPEPAPMDMGDKTPIDDPPVEDTPNTAPPAAAVPPVVAEQEKPPWQAALDDPNPPAFAEVCFDDFDTSRFLPQAADLQKWFETVAGHTSKIENVKSAKGQCGAIDGLVRLRSPWQDDSALRLSLEKYNRLQIHFFDGEQGVTLIYYESETYAWAAYATTRSAGSNKPDSFALTATDERRNRRTEIRFGGPFEIRHRDGELILSRGDIVLLRAPLNDPPADVYFEGHAEIYGLALVRTKDFPPRDPPPPVVAVVDRPADWQWVEQPGEGARVDRSEDGSIELIADSASARGWIAAPLPESDGIREYVLMFENATPGIGVLLTRPEPSLFYNHVLRFMRNTKSGRTCLATRGHDDAFEQDLGNLPEKIVPCTGQRQWIRLLVGCGVTRWWTSSDGEHWATTSSSIFTHPVGGVTHLVLTHVAKSANCRAKLRRVIVRELPELTLLAAKPARQQAAPSNLAPNIGAWIVEVTRTQPADVELDEWRRASAIRSLAAGCSKELGHTLVDLLLDDARARELPLEQQQRLIAEAALLQDMMWDAARLQKTIDRLNDIGLAGYQQHAAGPFSSIRQTLMTAPFGTFQNFNVRQPDLIRLELIENLYAARWDETVRLCRELTFFQQNQQFPLVDWADVEAQRQLPQSIGSTVAGARREEWRHPLDESLSKQAYNVLAELQAILDSDAYDDAARMIASVDPLSLSGVAPMADDRDLLVSLPAAFRLAVRQHEPLKTIIDQQYGQLAQLRVRQAIAAGDLSAIRLATVQFEATSAAAEAHRWLGDRALSSGWFTRALAEYQRAEANAAPGLRAELASRIRLASAMRGENAGQPATQPVVFGDVAMPAAEFESLIAGMIQRNQGALPVDSTSVSSAASNAVASPAKFEAHVRARLDGAVGEKPTDEITRHVRRYNVPWVDRQLALARRGDVLYVNNRFQVAAYGLNDGQRKWQSASPGGKMLRSQEWALTAMQPLVVGERIYARQLYGAGPMLVCLDASTGAIQWASEQPQNQFLVSDPFLVQDQLVALTLLRSGQNQCVLRLATIDGDTGETLEQQDLVHLRESWWRRRVCQVTPLDDALVASLGGIVICCDVAGQVRWMRKQIVMPTEEESNWVTQYFDRPLLDRGALYLAQPGVRTIDCVDPDTGNLRWSCVMPNVRRLLGVAGQRVIVATDDAVVGLERESGEIVWTTSLPSMLDAQLCGSVGRPAATGGGILVARKSAIDEPATKFRPRLVWLDPNTGKELAHCDLAGLDDADPRFGPLIAAGDRMWSFFGRGQDDPNRDFVELIPSGAAESSEPVVAQRDVWTSHVPARLHDATRRVLPAWSLLDGVAAASDGLVANVQNEKNVLSVSSAANSSVVLGRRVEVPANGQPRLRLRIGHSAGANLHVDVQAGEQTLHSQQLDAKFADQPWKELDVDLKSVKGRTVTLIVRSRNTNSGQPITVLWKRLDVVR